MNNEHGASLLEVLLVIGIISVLSPFIYTQVADTSSEIIDISRAREITSSRDAALNFVRVNQNLWPDNAQIKLDTDEIAQIDKNVSAAFIDKYTINGKSIVDIYLAFRPQADALRTARIARHIGNDDAAIVDDTKIAYAVNWAVSAPGFEPADLIYRINYDFSGEDTTKYLHRGTDGADKLNVMERALFMNKNDINRVGTVIADNGKSLTTRAAFIETDNIATTTAQFVGGANIEASKTYINSMRVDNDITGFRQISANTLNTNGFTSRGSIVTERATVNNSLNVGRDMTVKSDFNYTISDFTGISAHTLNVPFVSVDDITFLNNLGLTVSGELLMSYTPPIQIGNWYFPSSNPPLFKTFKLSNADIPQTPNKNEFEKLFNDNWKDAK